MVDNDYDYLYDYLYDLPWFTIFIYSSAIIALFAALYLERKDLFYPHGGSSKYGNGAAYEKGKIKHGDDYHTILQKLRISSRYDEASVYWRRCIIFTVLLMFTVLIIALQRLPTAYEVLVSFIVIYLFTYLMLVYYQNVVSIYATEQVDKGTKILEKTYKSG
jgi:hypothetical protein